MVMFLKLRHLIFFLLFGPFFLLLVKILYPTSSGLVFINQVGVLFKQSGNDKLSLPWYFANGSVRPNLEQSQSLRVWPEDLIKDRIHEQLMLTISTSTSKIRSIYVPAKSFNVELGQSYFVDSQCPVNLCTFVESKESADAVVFLDSAPKSRKGIPQSQIWILFILESPYVSGFDTDSFVNWSATYRSHSELVTPYEKWVYYDENIKENPANTKNYADGKTKMVAWFVSNCHASNKRLEYARELQNYINVDIYGRCGDKKCDRSSHKCDEMLSKTYKFYLAFENSNCREYITEKFFVNGLKNDIIPVVMGAHPDDYRRVAPEHSYIHVDDFQSARELADYLQILNMDDNLYNNYFKWKGTGEFIDTKFFCRLCALLHTPREPHFYPNFRQWWRSDDTCRQDSWSN